MSSPAVALKGCLGRIIVIGILFGGLNLLLYTCQEKNVEQYMPLYEEKKIQLESLRNRISSCKKDISKFKAQATDNTLPSNVFRQYKRTLVKCNQTVRDYNALVPKVNELSKKVNHNTYILPVPRRGMNSVHTK
jgi:hypothetical protein